MHLLTEPDPGSSRVLCFKKEGFNLYKLLFIENTYSVKDTVREYFSLIGNDEFSLDFACDSFEALNKVRSEHYDTVIIDIRMSDTTGIENCRRLRESSKCPILFISGLDNEEDVKQLYALGANDLIFKPLIVSELYEKVMRHLKRDGTDSGILECGGLRINPVTELVTLDGNILEVTPKGYMVLKLLIENKGEILNRELIMGKIWGDDPSVSDRAIDTQIKNLRKILGKKGNMIETVKGKGYRIDGN